MQKENAAHECVLVSLQEGGEILFDGRPNRIVWVFGPP